MSTKAIVAISLLTVAVTPVAWAQPPAPAYQDLVPEVVAATACQTRLSSDRSKVTLINGSWYLARGQLGPVEFECPIYTPWIDEDTGIRYPYDISLNGHDSSGSTTGTSVQALLLKVNYTSLLPFVVASLNTDNQISASVPGMTDAQYFMAITLVRANTNETVSFRGVYFYM